MSWDAHPPRLPATELSASQYWGRVVDIYTVNGIRYARHRKSNVILETSRFNWVFGIKLQKLCREGYLINNLD